MQLRLDKFLADAGAGTRTKVKTLIKQGRIKVNDINASKPDIKVNTDKDRVSLDGKIINYNEYEYFMLNKPAGVISAATDNRQQTVVDLITGQKRRDLFPVGRLDKDTEGLIIITNDGPLCNNLLAPGKHVDKVYFAKIHGEVTEKEVEKFEEGLDIGDEKPTKPAVLVVEKIYDESGEVYSEIKITITEGRYHQIKRMFEAVGMEVVYLKRLSMGKISLDESLKPGEFRKLTEEEMKLI